MEHQTFLVESTQSPDLYQRKSGKNIVSILDLTTAPHTVRQLAFLLFLVNMDTENILGQFLDFLIQDNTYTFN